MAGIEKKFELPKEEIFVRYIRRQKGLITDEKHVAFGGLLEGSGITLPAKQLKNGNYANVLSDVEKAGLEDIMGLPLNALSIYNKVDNFWDKIAIRLTKEGQHFNLNDPDDYIKVKVLESYTDSIASSLKEKNKNNKATYKFVIIRKDEESKIYNEEVDVKTDAYLAFAKISENKEAMESLLSVLQIRIASNSSEQFVKKTLAQQVEKNPKKIISTLNDHNYKIKVLINKGITKGVIKFMGGRHLTSDNMSIAHVGEESTLANAIAFLNSGEGQEMRLILEKQIEETSK